MMSGWVKAIVVSFGWNKETPGVFSHNVFDFEVFDTAVDWNPGGIEAPATGNWTKDLPEVEE